MKESPREEAQAYLRAARGGWAKPEKFPDEAVYQLIALAVEGFWTAWLESRGVYPDHHTFPALLIAAEKLGPLPVAVKQGMQKMIRWEGLCDGVIFTGGLPNRNDLAELLKAASEIEAFTADSSALVQV